MNTRGPEGETALHLAAAGGHHEVAKFLLNEGAEADIQDDVSSFFFTLPVIVKPNDLVWPHLSPNIM